MAGESRAGRNSKYVQSEIKYLIEQTDNLSVGGNSTIFKADEPESPVISLGLFRENYDLKTEAPLKTIVLIAFLLDMGMDQPLLHRLDMGMDQVMALENWEEKRTKALENWEDIREKVVKGNSGDSGDSVDSVDSGDSGDTGESIKTVTTNMRLQYEPSPHLTDEEPIQSVLALDAIFITCFIICVCFGNNEVTKLTSDRLYRENDSVKSQLYNAIFKMENQIPLSLILNVVSYIYRDRRPAIRRDTIIEICDGMRDTYLKRFPSCVFPQTVQKTPDDKLTSLKQDHHLLYCIAKAFRSENSSKERSCWATLGRSTTRGSPAGDNNGSYNQLAGGPPEDTESHHCVPNCMYSLIGRGSTEDLESQNQRTNCVPKWIYNLMGGEDNEPSPFQLKPIAEKTQLPTAEELYKMGIRFEGQKEFFPKFKRHTFVRWRATLFLPYIPYIGGGTKECWVNLLDWEYKYEHSSLAQRDKQGQKEENQEKRRNIPFTQYLCFMKNLVNSEEDVKVLLKERNSVIGVADLGDHKQVAELFSSAVTTIFTRYDNDWMDLVKDIENFHTNSLRRTWVAFVDQYFKTPWLAVSVVASFILLVCSLVQAISSTAGLLYS